MSSRHSRARALGAFVTAVLALGASGAEAATIQDAPGGGGRTATVVPGADRLALTTARARRGGPRARDAPRSGGIVDVPGARRDGGSGQLSQLDTLGLTNPVCRTSEGRARRNCARTGTPEGTWPAGNYGLDINIDAGLTDIGGHLASAFAAIANFIWLGALYVLKLIFSLLGWAFSLNPFADGRIMGEISRGLERFYRIVTQPWIVALLVVLGGWLLWRGLVQGRVVQGLGGTLFALVGMLLALWVLHQPRETVGRLADFSNEMAAAVIGAPVSRNLSNPVGSYAEATAQAWERIVGPPFRGLNFSDQRWAERTPPREAVEAANGALCSDADFLRSLPYERLARLDTSHGLLCTDAVSAIIPPARTNAELYLRSSPGSAAREALWRYWHGREADGLDGFLGIDKGDAGANPAAVAIQGKEGADNRVPLAVLFAIGLLGAILLLGWLSLRLMVQAAVAFVLLLATPLAFFMPAFGESGRRSFAIWAMTLLGAIVAKVIYAAVLAVVVFGTIVIGEALPGEGSVVPFLVSAGFWWAIFLKREDLLGWVSVKPSGDEGGSGTVGSLSGAYLGSRLAGAAGEGLGRGRAGLQRGRYGHWKRSHDKASATSAMAVGALAGSAGKLADARYAQAAQTAADHSALGRRLERTGEELAKARGAREKLGLRDPSERELELARRRDRLQAQHDAEREEALRAEELLRRANGNEARPGDRWAPEDRARFEEELRSQLDQPLTSGVHAWRAGVSRGEYAGAMAAGGRGREELLRKVGPKVRADRLAVSAIPDRPDGAPPRLAQLRYRSDAARRATGEGGAPGAGRHLAERARRRGEAGRRRRAAQRAHRVRRGISR